jgi:hypothetical protein
MGLRVRASLAVASLVFISVTAFAQSDFEKVVRKLHSSGAGTYLQFGHPLRSLPDQGTLHKFHNDRFGVAAEVFRQLPKNLLGKRSWLVQDYFQSSFDGQVDRRILIYSIEEGARPRLIVELWSNIEAQVLRVKWHANGEAFFNHEDSNLNPFWKNLIEATENISQSDEVDLSDLHLPIGLFVPQAVRLSLPLVLKPQDTEIFTLSNNLVIEREYDFDGNLRNGLKGNLLQVYLHETGRVQSKQEFPLDFETMPESSDLFRSAVPCARQLAQLGRIDLN